MPQSEEDEVLLQQIVDDAFRKEGVLFATAKYSYLDSKRWGVVHAAWLWQAYACFSHVAHAGPPQASRLL